MNDDTTNNGQPSGKGFRPAYHALWHLADLGVLDKPDPLKTFASKAWAAADYNDDKTRVAIIDTPVAYDHPNLRDAIDVACMRDFSLSDPGDFVIALPCDKRAQESRTNLLDRMKHAKSHRDTDGFLCHLDHEIGKLPDWPFEDTATGSERGSEPEPPEKFREAVREIVDHCFEAITARIEEENTHKKRDEQVKKAPSVCAKPPIVPGAHGTALAGLIGARPTKAKLRRPDYFGEEERSSDLIDIELPYCGVNPFCKIVPVSLSAGPDPKMLLGALIYTIFVESDVVVIADSWDRPRDWKKNWNSLIAWTAVEIVFLLLCKESIVFCAAGNEPLDRPVYPASLARKSRCGKNGPIPASGPWAVGACDKDGNDLTYSPNSAAIDAAGFRMVRTLSTEHSRYDREWTRLDPWAIVDDQLGRPPSDPRFPPHDIVATDMPGPAGYSPSPFHHTPKPGADDEHYEIGSLYCRFSGTSAATAIAAGLASLAIATPGNGGGGEPRDPSQGVFRLEQAEWLVG